MELGSNRLKLRVCVIVTRHLAIGGSAIWREQQERVGPPPGCTLALTWPGEGVTRTWMTVPGTAGASI